jgi:hypothetical protein
VTSITGPASTQKERRNGRNEERRIEKKNGKINKQREKIDKILPIIN